MQKNRFLVIIAHPAYGRLVRAFIPRRAMHFAGALLIVMLGAAADYYRQSSESDRLASENAVLRTQYDTLQATLDERDVQLRSLNSLAYQLSVAYGIRRDALEAEVALGPDVQPAYYASFGQYDLIRRGLSESRLGLPSQSLMANTTPSIWPVRGRITSSYGKRQDPFSGEGSFHPGIDISAPHGSPVVATADGHVVSASWDGAFGRRIRLQHGRSGFETVYGHLREYFVSVGQSVRRGEVIGLVGNSGRTTGKHLHYEVHYNRLNVNPYRYLRNRELRYETSLTD